MPQPTRVCSDRKRIDAACCAADGVSGAIEQAPLPGARDADSRKA